MFKAKIRKQLKHYKKLYPQLNDWEISVGDDDYKNEVHIHPKKKSAIICDCSHKPYPDRYTLHEVLHILLEDLKREKNRKEYIRKSEILIASTIHICTRYLKNQPY